MSRMPVSTPSIPSHSYRSPLSLVIGGSDLVKEHDGVVAKCHQDSGRPRRGQAAEIERLKPLAEATKSMQFNSRSLMKHNRVLMERIARLERELAEARGSGNSTKP